MVVMDWKPGSGRCLIVAEVAQAHDGSLGSAHAHIDAAAGTGADAVKFQTHIASAESTSGEPWRVKFSRQDASRYDYWKRMEFTAEQWLGLKRHADDRGLLFLSSAFSVEAAELLTRVGVSAWKVASGEVANPAIFETIVETGLPILLSTGMSGLPEIDESVRALQGSSVPFTLLQCTSVYPCPAEKVGLSVLSDFRQRYDCSVGLSDHSGTVFPGLAAAWDGIDVLEVHITMSREAFGPDVVASVTTDELKQLVEGVRFIETMKANPVNKDEMAKELSPLRDLFTKSIVTRVELPPGTALEKEHLTVKKPGTGIPASRMKEVLHRRTKRGVAADTLLSLDDLE
jgi:N-acetylneuraminate synthase